MVISTYNEILALLSLKDFGVFFSSVVRRHELLIHLGIVFEPYLFFNYGHSLILIK